MNNPSIFKAVDEKTGIIQPGSWSEVARDIKQRRTLRTFVVKQFGELNTRELFEIYQLRSKVFVQEQNCAYQDVDQKDLIAYHVLMLEGDRIEGYSRLLPP